MKKNRQATGIHVAAGRGREKRESEPVPAVMLVLDIGEDETVTATYNAEDAIHLGKTLIEAAINAQLEKPSSPFKSIDESAAEVSSEEKKDAN